RGLVYTRQYREAYRLRQLTYAKTVHHARAMDLDRSNADAEIVGDDLIRTPHHQGNKNLRPARCERCDPVGLLGGFAAEIRAIDPGQRRFDGAEQDVVAVGLFD